MQAVSSDLQQRTLEGSLRGQRRLLYAAAALSLADALIHILVIRDHFAEWWGYGAFFLVLASAQAVYSAALLRWPRQPLLLLGIGGVLGVIGLYAVTRALGIPLGPHAGHAEEVGTIDLTSKALELGLLTALAWLLRGYRNDPVVRRAAPGETSPAPAARRRVPGHPLLKLAAGALVIVALLLVGYRFGTGLDFGGQRGTVSTSDSEACARRGCDVHFTATLATQRYAERLGIWDQVAPRLRMAQGFVLNATTHAGTVRNIPLENKVFLQDGEVLYPAAGQPIGLSTHHNTYLVFFPRYDMNGRPLFERQAGQFNLVIKGADAAQTQRTLTFNYPLPATSGAGLPLPQVLMTIGAAMAALLFACTPCLVGSLAVGSLTTGAATGSNRAAALQRARRAMIRQTLAYLAALVVIYLAVAVAVNVWKLQTEDLRPVEFVGGLVLLVLGLGLLRGSRLGLWAQRGLLGVLGKVVPGLRKYGGGGSPEVALDGKASSAMGASLAMVCSVAGAPTLSTAILLPLLVYAGLSHPIWAFLILLVYLAVCSLPFFFVAVGWGELLLSASLRTRTALLTTSALLLVGLGLLLVFSPATVADTVSAPARLILMPLRWLA